MDAIALFVILFLFVILILIIAIVLLNKSTNSNSGTTGNTGAFNSSTTPIYEVDYWSGATGTTGPLSVCNIFYFQGGIQGDTAFNYNINNLVPVQVSNCLSVDQIALGLTGIACFGPQPAAGFKCVDPDQLSLKQVQHTCGATGSNGLGCVSNSGSHFAPGSTETFLTTCGLKPCTDTLASIVLNYNLSTDLASTVKYMYCVEPFITFGPTGPTGATGVQDVIMYANRCAYSINQQWKITRANINSSGNGFVKSNTGVYAQIQNRQSGLCLISKTQGINTFPTLGACTANSYPWVFTNGFHVGALTTPPQISWVGDKIVPITNVSQLINWLDSSSPNSLAVGGDTGTEEPSKFLVLQPFALKQNQGDFFHYKANYLDFALFNFILQNQNNYPLVPAGT
jgi:hypothetical protein